MDTELMRMTITSVYYISSTKMNILSCSKLNGWRVSTEIEQWTGVLMDRSDDTTFAKIKRKESAVSFIIKMKKR